MITFSEAETNFVSALHPSPHSIWCFLSLWLRRPLRQSSENYFQSSFFLIKYTVLFSLQQEMSFASTTPNPSWPFSEMHRLREKFLPSIKAVFLNFTPRVKWWIKREEEPSLASRVSPLGLLWTQADSLHFLPDSRLSGLLPLPWGSHHHLYPGHPVF